jgi:hypothetical protein
MACGNCGAELTGAFCQACGQKRLTPRDRTLAHLLGDAFQQVTELDGKLLRSLRLLLFSPGVLSREYMDDRRVRYASPISLFLLANVLYFFAPALSDFNLPFADQVPGSIVVRLLDPAVPGYAGRRQRLAGNRGQAHSHWTAPMVERKLAARVARDPAYTLRQLAGDYDREAGIVGKVLIVVHVPIIAFALALVYWRRRRYFVEHFVVALHLFTVLLLFAQLVVAPLNWLADRAGIELSAASGQLLKLFLTTVVFGYILLACRNAYRCGWGAALFGLFGVLVGLLIANLWVYRALQFLITLALI